MSMHANKKSDSAILPGKVLNNGAQARAEALEERAGPKGSRHQISAVWTQSQVAASQGLMAVRQLAQRDKGVKFTALLHHVDVALLRRSYFSLKRNAAPGIDGTTWEEYGEQLDEQLCRLHDDIHRGRYRARPARRTCIPKPDGSERPLSILCLEDKIVQQAIVDVLNAVYETDFLGFSYGFRPGRGQHDALDALQAAIYRRKVNWILDADIRLFFDSMSHHWMMQFLEHRIADKRLLRLIQKWLKVGVKVDGKVQVSEIGAPQGSVISPVLANIYLHYVFDLWVNKWREKRARGDMIFIRYADDSVAGFQTESEARSFLVSLEVRLEKFGLALHSDKTRLIRFGRFAAEQCKRAGAGKPEVFNFLGFTHYCTRSYKSGGFVVGRKTIKKRMRAQLKTIKQELRRRLHRPITETGNWLRKVLRGHLNYYAIPGNGKSISSFVYLVSQYWLKSIRRRSQRHAMTWEKFSAIKNYFFPPVKILHPLPLHRFDARTRGRSPVR